MNTLPSDSNESIVDIFVLSGSSSVASPLKDSLEEGGYRVTHFTDGTQLLESLQSGIPNLLICDATTDGTSGYDMCRGLKADDNLWMIPVLILSRTNGLADLLSVLDCNAENFVAYPCEPPFLISLIEGMLVTPVERQTAEMVKTQFRIQHDEKVYVVTADRRKLLELLLSSFETAVNISSDHSESREEVRQLNLERTDLREKLQEQTRAADNFRESLRQKELNVRALSGILENRVKELAEKSAEIDTLQKDRVDDRALIAAAEEHIRTMLQQKEEMLSSHRAETIALEQRVSELSVVLDAKKSDLDRLGRELEVQATKRAEFEQSLAVVIPQKEEAENALRDLRVESEQLSTDLAEKTNLLETVSGELKEARDAGAQREQDLGKEIVDLRQTVSNQIAMLDELKNELGVEARRAISAYESLTALQSEKEQSESLLRAGSDSLKQQLGKVQTELDTTIQSLKEEERRRTASEASLGNAQADKEKLGEQISLLSKSLAEVQASYDAREIERQALEQDFASVSSEKTRFEDNYHKKSRALEEAMSELQEEKSRNDVAKRQMEASLKEKEEVALALREELSGAGRDLETASSQISSLEDALKTTSLASEENSNEYNRALDRAKRDLEARTAEIEQLTRDSRVASARIETLEEELRTANLAKEETAQEHLREIDTAKKTLEIHTDEMIQLNRDFASATSRISTLENELKAVSLAKENALEEHRSALDEAKQGLDRHVSDIQKKQQEATELSARIDLLEDELRTAARSGAESDQKARSLGEELEHVRAELENERRHHREDTGKLLALASEKEKLEKEFLKSADRIEEAGSVLSSEKDLRKAAEEQAIAAEREKDRISVELDRVSGMLKRMDEDYSAKNKELSASTDRALKEQKSLEQKLESVSSEKDRAEQKNAALMIEIEQARIALADEWESHMNADEQLAIAESSSIQLQQAEKSLDALAAELQQARAALADEWEDHMNANERLAALDKKNEQLRQSLSFSGQTKDIPPHTTELSLRDTSLPVLIRPKSTSLSNVDIPNLHSVHGPKETESAKESVSGTVAPPAPETDQRIASDVPLEDLFEDVDPVGQSEPPQVLPVPEETGTDIVPETYQDEEEDVGNKDEVESDENEMVNNNQEYVNNSSPYIPDAGPVSFNRKQWFDLFAWARHADALTADQRMEIIRMGRLIQRGRKLTLKQDARIREMIELAQSHGYHIS